MEFVKNSKELGWDLAKPEDASGKGHVVARYFKACMHSLAVMLSCLEPLDDDDGDVAIGGPGNDCSIPPAQANDIWAKVSALVSEFFKTLDRSDSPNPYAEITDYVVNMLEVLRALVPFYQAPNKMQDLGNFAYKLLNYREGFKVTYFMTT